jgi:cell filamentation protein
VPPDYDVFDDPYCYKGTFVLKNRAGIRDASALEAFEQEMSTLRAEEPLPDGNFTTSHYRTIHRHLFQDVYRWAGRYRTVRTGKNGNWFCYPEHIAPSMDATFAKLASEPFLPQAGPAIFIEAAADFLAELNAIHSFRDGNGRSQLAFLHLIALRAGHPLQLERIKSEPFLAAMIASFGGDLELLQSQLRELVA